LNDPLTKIAPGSQVTMHFSLALTDGTEAASTFGDEPTTFTMGDGTLSEGLEMALYGLMTGAEQILTLEPDQAFGLRDEAKIHPMPLGDFGPEMELEPGLVIGFSTPDGEELAGIVLDIGEDKVTVDFNHPLAGNQVVFKVEILDIQNPQPILDSKQ